MRSSTLPFIIITSLFLSACGGGGSMYRQDAAHTGVASSTAPTNKDYINQVWKWSAPDTVYSSPVVAGNTV